MLKNFMSIALVTILVWTVGGTSAFASIRSGTDAKSKVAETRVESAPTKREARVNEKLTADMLKLIADAKAGKLTPAERPQIGPAQSKNFSKRTKIAIGVGIAVAIVAVVLIVRSPILHDGR